jgi:hypothetical protein
MELRPEGEDYVNGLGEVINLEDHFLYPMLKSSDIGNGRSHCRNVMLVTQQVVGQDTSHIERKAAKTWEYLLAHTKHFERRASSVYRNKPAFSVFGVGPYSFSPWKVAISAFYKKLQFVCTGPVDGKPVVLDDTVYFLPCASEAEARFLEFLLTSEPATEFFLSMISWDEKRPITIDVLKRLSIAKLAKLLGKERDYVRFTAAKNARSFTGDPQNVGSLSQGDLFGKNERVLANGQSESVRPTSPEEFHAKLSQIMAEARAARKSQRD